MVVPLKGEELMDGGDGGGVRAPEPYSRTSRNGVGRVPDGRSERPHLTSSRNLPSVHKTGQSEVAASEGAGDPPHVSSNPRHSSSVARVSLEGDAAAIRQRLELVK